MFLRHFFLIIVSFRLVLLGAIKRLRHTNELFIFFSEIPSDFLSIKMQC